MKGYYHDRRSYLTGDEDRDIMLALVLCVLVFNFSVCMSAYALLKYNVHADWAENGVVFTGAEAFHSVFTVPLAFIAIQYLRSLFRYTAGYEHWHHDNAEFLSFELHLGFEWVRGLILLVICLAGVGLQNAVLQHTDMRSDAVDYGYGISVGFIIASIAVPLFFYAIYKIRQHRLRKLETYRQLGGEGY